MTKSIKLTRKEITEGLKNMPIENILVGAHNADKVRLTKKQKDFARKVAEGKPKAQAYRESYNSKAKPATQSNEGHKLMKNPAISAMIEAFTLANEAREYLIPAQIRTMAIQNLVTIAIDDGEKTSNKLKALELIGKMSEVSLFAETKTHLHLHSSQDIKGRLLESLRLAFSSSRSINDLAKRKAESLLIELSEPIEQDETTTHDEILEPATPLHPDPQKLSNTESETLHSIPLKQSDSNDLLQDLTITGVIVTTPLESNTCASIGINPNALDDDSEGEGVLNSGQADGEELQKTPPVTISNEKG
jgi:hypothetical protein